MQAQRKNKHSNDNIVLRITKYGQLLVVRTVVAWHRHRVSDAKGEQAAGGLFGLDLSAREVERGQAFVSGVLERQGEDGLAKLLHRGSSLPTSAELEAPGLWLERLALPELDPGSDSAS